MTRIPTMVFSALMLAGCADNYDRTAMPEASIFARQASLNCEAKWAFQEITTNSEMAACSLTAERRYFTAIKLRKMDEFEAYAVGYQTLAADLDAHRISDQQANRRARNMRRDFLAACHCTRQPSGASFIESPRALGPFGP